MCLYRADDQSSRRDFLFRIISHPAMNRRAIVMKDKGLSLAKQLHVFNKKALSPSLSDLSCEYGVGERLR